MISIALLLIAIVPWASAFLSEFSISGLGSAKLRALEDKTNSALAQAREAGERAAGVEEKAEELYLSGRRRVSAAPGFEKNLEDLANTYLKVRERMGRGDARTSQMTELFGKMVTEAEALGRSWRETALEWISERDAGRNLSAIAFMYVFPDVNNIPSLLNCIDDTTQSFVQYWGLRALQRAVDLIGPAGLSDDVRRRISALPQQFAPSSDRGRLSASIAGRVLKSG